MSLPLRRLLQLPTALLQLQLLLIQPLRGGGRIWICADCALLDSKGFDRTELHPHVPRRSECTLLRERAQLRAGIQEVRASLANTSKGKHIR